MDKEDVIHTHTDTHTHTAIKKIKFCHLQQRGWMDLEGIMLGEINQTERDKYCMISLICGI